MTKNHRKLYRSNKIQRCHKSKKLNYSSKIKLILVLLFFMDIIINRVLVKKKLFQKPYGTLSQVPIILKYFFFFFFFWGGGDLGGSVYIIS